MENAVLFSAVNVNLTLVYRMLQRKPPLSIRLHRIREYETPFGTSLKCMKFTFTMLILYMGIPVSLVYNTLFFPMYMIHWFFTILWWNYFVTCQFKKCVYVSSANSAVLLFFMSLYFQSHPNVVYFWMVPLWWSCYTLYVSIWYRNAYVKTSLILP